MLLKMIGEYSNLRLFLSRLLSHALKRRSDICSAFFYLLKRRIAMAYKYTKGSQVIGDLKAADDADISMAFTGIRHFNH